MHRGIGVVLVTCAGDDVSSEAKAVEKILPVITLGARFAARYFVPAGDRGLPELKRYIEAADVVHVHGMWSVVNHAACRIAVESRRPLIVSPRGMLEPWALHEKKFRKKAAWFTYQRTDLADAQVLHATSEQEAEQIRRLLRNRTNVIVVPNGCDLPDSSIPNEPKQRRILFLSRIHKKKGLLLLVEAAARLASALRRGEWEIAVVGPDEGGHLAEVREAVCERAVGDLFRFYLPLDGAEKWHFLRSSELFILPTKSENFGMVIAEALAAAVPCITTTAAPWEELIGRNCGWWCDPTAEGVTAALKEALMMPVAQLREMGARGRSLIEERYSWKIMALRMEHAYDLAIRSSAGVAPTLAET
jgi:glycosyltransferase involved in cell wall biosynthesis